jgi:hypothetical protein
VGKPMIIRVRWRGGKVLAVRVRCNSKQDVPRALFHVEQETPQGAIDKTIKFLPISACGGNWWLVEVPQCQQ